MGVDCTFSANEPDFPRKRNATSIKLVGFCPDMSEYAQHIVRIQHVDRLTPRMTWEESAPSLDLIHAVLLHSSLESCVSWNDSCQKQTKTITCLFTTGSLKANTPLCGITAG